LTAEASSLKFISVCVKQALLRVLDDPIALIKMVACDVTPQELESKVSEIDEYLQSKKTVDDAAPQKGGDS
jgi:hypothetical protein